MNAAGKKTQHFTPGRTSRAWAHSTRAQQRLDGSCSREEDVILQKGALKQESNVQNRSAKKETRTNDSSTMKPLFPGRHKDSERCTEE